MLKSRYVFVVYNVWTVSWVVRMYVNLKAAWLPQIQMCLKCCSIAFPCLLKPVKDLQHPSMWEADAGNVGNHNRPFIWKRGVYYHTINLFNPNLNLIKKNLFFNPNLIFCLWDVCNISVMSYPDKALCLEVTSPINSLSLGWSRHSQPASPVRGYIAFPDEPVCHSWPSHDNFIGCLPKNITTFLCVKSCS